MGAVHCLCTACAVQQMVVQASRTEFKLSFKTTKRCCLHPYFWASYQHSGICRVLSGAPHKINCLELLRKKKLYNPLGYRNLQGAVWPCQKATSTCQIGMLCSVASFCSQKSCQVQRWYFKETLFKAPLESSREVHRPPRHGGSATRPRASASRLRPGSGNPGSGNPGANATMDAMAWRHRQLRSTRPDMRIEPQTMKKWNFYPLMKVAVPKQPFFAYSTRPRKNMGRKRGRK